MEFEIAKDLRDALIAAAQARGATVKEDWNEPEGARFIGTIDGSTITLFPKFDSHFAMYFTTAHLYGHLVQAKRPTPDSERAMSLVYRKGEPFVPADVQAIYDYEYEA